MSTRKHIVGNMTRDIDLKYSQAGKPWGVFSVASNDGKDDSKTECFTDCKVFGDMAENVAASLSKGSRVILEGREQTEKWESNGEQRSRNVLIVDAIGPDLRFATARVERTSTVMTGSGQVKSTPVTTSGWDSVPPSNEEPAPW